MAGSSDAIRREQSGWGAPASLRFYEEHRSRPADLYPSERFFLPDVLPRVSTCLDVGCAAGGFSGIMKSFNPRLRYTGVDIVPAFIEKARRLHPEDRFDVGDGVRFDTPPGSYDLVHLSGLLHLNSRHRDLLRSAYEQAEKYVLCDFRLTDGPPVTGTFRVAFGEAASDAPRLPYIVLNVSSLTEELRSLVPAPAAIRGKGYWHAPSGDADVPLKEVLMAFFLIEKGTGASAPVVDLAFPPREGA